jgi:uncharacterized protein
VKNQPRIFAYLLLFCLVLSCKQIRSASKTVSLSSSELAIAQQLKPGATPLEKALANSIEQTTITVSYDPSYIKIAYPNGDVPVESGVCADVIIRAFRQGGVDLQKEVHEDMTRNFKKYPQKWGAKRPDRNIDHRRVANLMTWFERQGKNLALSDNANDYRAGDVVAWELDNGRLHIGLVSGIKIEGTDRLALVHNIGLGARLEDVLFAWKIIGHYRYF